MAVSPADHCSGLVISMRIAPVLAVLRCVALARLSSGGGVASLGTGGAGTDGGSGTWGYRGGRVEELEVPGVCPVVAVGLSLSGLVALGDSVGAVAPHLRTV